MNRPEASLLGRLERPWTEAALRKAVGEIVAGSGFERFALMTIPSTDEAGAEMRPILSNWDDEFRVGFERFGLHRFSPVLRALIGGTLPFVWDVEFVYGFDPDDPDGSPAPGRFLAAHGCQSGVYCPVHGITGFTGVWRSRAGARRSARRRRTGCSSWPSPPSGPSPPAASRRTGATTR